MSFDQTPDDPTEERSASFEFSSDEDVDRFQCSPDAAGNVGEPAEADIDIFAEP